MSKKQWNPLYVEYARCHGNRSPDEMLIYDNNQMYKYIIWNRNKWCEFYNEFPEYKFEGGPTEEGIKKYAEWLKTQN